MESVVYRRPRLLPPQARRTLRLAAMLTLAGLLAYLIGASGW
jgi:hypothetical protein